MTVSVLWLFLTLPWVGLHYVIVVFSDHTCLLFLVYKGITKQNYCYCLIVICCLSITKLLSCVFIHEKYFQRMDFDWQISVL